MECDPQLLKASAAALTQGLATRFKVRLMAGYRDALVLPTEAWMVSSVQEFRERRPSYEVRLDDAGDRRVFELVDRAYLDIDSTWMDENLKAMIMTVPREGEAQRLLVMAALIAQFYIPQERRDPDLQNLAEFTRF